MSRSATHVQPGKTAIARRREDAKWRREDHAARDIDEQLGLINQRPGKSMRERLRITNPHRAIAVAERENA